MVFLGAVVLPHGTMTFDGQGDQSASESCRSRCNSLPAPLRAELSSLFTACIKVAECIAKLKPDVVVLHTPHGLSLSNNLGVYLNNVAKGNALWNDKWNEFEVELPMDREIAQKILQRLREDNLGAEGVNCFAVTEAPLRWGEVVPSWYLQQEFKKSGFQPKYVILSQSLKKHGSKSNEERIAIGTSLAGVLNTVDEKVVVAISGDLSHAHCHSYQDFPLYVPDPRWNMPQSDKAELFDRAIEGWATSCNYDLLLSNDQLPTSYDKDNWDASLALKWLYFASDLQPVALSCGIGGFFVLHGLLSHYTLEKTIFSQVFGRFAPTYYGMMAAMFSVD